MSEDNTTKQEGEKTYPYTASIYEMYVMDGITKMTEIGLQKYIDEYTPFMPADLQSVLRNMDIGGTLTQDQVDTITAQISKELLAKPLAW